MTVTTIKEGKLIARKTPRTVYLPGGVKDRRNQYCANSDSERLTQMYNNIVVTKECIVRSCIICSFNVTWVIWLPKRSQENAVVSVGW